MQLLGEATALITGGKGENPPLTNDGGIKATAVRIVGKYMTSVVRVRNCSNIFKKDINAGENRS